MRGEEKKGEEERRERRDKGNIPSNLSFTEEANLVRLPCRSLVQHDVRRRKRRVSNKERCEADRLM